jgi:CheY-like chemotaxis protein
MPANVQRSTFNFQRSMAEAWRSSFVIHPSPLSLLCETIVYSAGRWSAFCYLISQAMGNALRILTVEDEPAVTQLLALMLGGPTAKVTSAADGWEALMKIGAAAQPFDVIITDHRMPRVTGLDLVRQLRKREFDGKIIVLSAHLTDENIRAYEELKVDMMIAKPFDVEELRAAMELLTKQPSRPVAAHLAEGML